MERKNLLKWILWHDYRGSLAWLKENGKIVCAGVARLVQPLMLGVVQLAGASPKLAQLPALVPICMLLVLATP